MMPTLIISHGRGHNPGGEPGFSVSQRGRMPTQWLIDRDRHEAMTMVGCLYNLCAAAQSAAAAKAMDLPLAPDCHRHIQLETLREHALVMLRDWPGVLGMTMDADSLKGLAGLSLTTLDVLEARVFAEPAERALEDIEAWLERAPSRPAEVLRRVADWPREYGRIAVADDPTFVGRVAGHASLRGLIAGDGWSLYARMLARVVEVAQLIVALRVGAGNCTAGESSDVDEPRCGRAADGSGWAEAARGRLVHRVACRDDRVVDYRIITPTDAMLDGTIGPDGERQPGFLSRLLESAHGQGECDSLNDGLSDGDNRARQRVAMALSCADPCLPVVWQESSEALCQGPSHTQGQKTGSGLSGGRSSCTN